jgi:hypothetical protein
VHSEPLLVADEARGALAKAVAPFVSAVLEQLDGPGRELAEGRIGVEVNGRSYRCRVVVLVQAHPSLCRVVLIGLPKAVELDRLPGELVPGLDDAIESVLLGVLASLGDGADVAIAAAAAQRHGGFLIAFDPQNGRVTAYVGKAGEDLGRAVEIGGIGDAPARAH